MHVKVWCKNNLAGFEKRNDKLFSVKESMLALKIQPIIEKQKNK